LRKIYLPRWQEFITRPARVRPAIAVTFLAIAVGTGLRVSQEFAAPSAAVRILAAAKDFAFSRF
jgi:hypothetical protein